MMHSNGRQSVKPGDMLKIPYGESAVYGQIVYCDAKGTPISRRRGLYLVVFDAEVFGFDSASTLSSELDLVLTSPVMLGPLHCTDELVKDFRWKVVGHRAFDKEIELPHFFDGTGIVDYFYRRVSDTPANRAKVMEEFVVPPEMVENAIRAKRNLSPWLPGYDYMLPPHGAELRPKRR